ncbi:MAG: LCP family protein [Clostridia bacterium]|nr:LCP family protein [Clostridia bacterium]
MAHSYDENPMLFLGTDPDIEPIEEEMPAPAAIEETPAESEAPAFAELPELPDFEAEPEAEGEPEELPELPEGEDGKPPRKIRGWRIAVSSAMAVVGVLVICVAVLLSSAYGLLGDINYLGSGEDSEIDHGALNQDDVEGFTPEDLSSLEVRGNNDYVTNYLLIGCDARGSSRGLSDTMIIFSINDATKTIKMISLMRDTWVNIPAAGYYSKLNAAYPYAGFEGLLDTIESNFCLDIDQAIRVDLKGFSNAIDALGGVDIELTGREARCLPLTDPGDPDIFAVKTGSRGDWYTLIREPIGTTDGTYHLEGFQAMRFARLRKIYPDSDYTRVKNQRKLIGIVMNRAFENPTKIFGAASEILKEVTLYNITKSEVLDYAYNATKYLGYKIESDYELTYRGGRSQGGQSILTLPDQQQQVMALHEYLYATETTPSSTAAQ